MDRIKLASARFFATSKTPYFTQALLSAVLREVPNGSLTGDSHGTLAMTDTGVMLIENAAVQRWTTQELGSVMIHEIMHWLRRHGDRRKRLAANARLWNLAADCEINDDLHAMKLPLPDGGGIQPKLFGLENGKTAEAYYVALTSRSEEEQKLLPPCACGSCAGNAVPHEPEEKEGAGRSQPEVEIMQAQVANAVLDHVHRHGAGSVPGGLQRWAEAALKPSRVSWQRKLAYCGRQRLAMRAGAHRTTYQKISRQQAGLGFGVGKPIIPAPTGSKPHVAVAIDTSGSMGKADLERAVIETTAIIKATGATVDLVAADCAVHTVSKVRNAQQVLNALKGGGGTDFRPAIKHFAEARQKPDILIFITDGGGYAPARAPQELAVIWLLVGKHHCRPYEENTNHSIAWGDIIEVDDE